MSAAFEPIAVANFWTGERGRNAVTPEDVLGMTHGIGLRWYYDPSLRIVFFETKEAPGRAMVLEPDGKGEGGEWLRLYLLNELQRVVAEAPWKSASDILHAQAKRSATRTKTGLRWAGTGDGAEQVRILDLNIEGDNNVVVMHANGWYVGPCPTGVYYRRSEDLHAIPTPVAGTTYEQLKGLGELAHVDDDDLPLLWAWLACAVLGLPTPILWLGGESGAGKSSVGQALQALIDPLPDEAKDGAVLSGERDFVAAVYSKAVLNLGNMSGVSVSLSDALCKVATGSQQNMRTYYTTATSRGFVVRRPIIITAISEGFLQGDLRTRMVKLDLHPFEGKRMSDDTWAAKLAEFQPIGTGAVADLVSNVIRLWDEVDAPSDTRMGGYERVLRAVDRLFGTKAHAHYVAQQLEHLGDQADEDEFLREFQRWVKGENRDGLPKLGLKPGEAKDVPLSKVVEQVLPLRGTSRKAEDTWPKSERAVSGALTRGAGALRERSVQFTTLGRKIVDGQKVTVIKVLRGLDP